MRSEAATREAEKLANESALMSKLEQEQREKEEHESQLAKDKQMKEEQEMREREEEREDDITTRRDLVFERLNTEYGEDDEEFDYQMIAKEL